MIRTYKFRLYPTKNQQNILKRVIETCRILYNSYLIDRKNYYEENKKGLSLNAQGKVLVKDKGRHAALGFIYSQVLTDVLVRLDKAYQNFFRRVKRKEKPGYPRLKGEGHYHSLTYPQKGFKITRENKLYLSKIGHIKIKMHRSLEGKIKTCTISKDIDRWYACFTVETLLKRIKVPNRAIGIDVGIKNFATLSDGTVIDNPKYLKRSETKLKRLQRALSKKKKGSKNRSKAKGILSRLHRKVREQRKDFHHKVSRSIVNNFSHIKVEDLQINNMVKNHCLAKSISDSGWGQFISFLTYKAENAGSVIERVNARNTSQKCSNCGEIVKKSLAIRTHNCPNCGLVLDRDHNAAINILNTVGTTGIKASGESRVQTASMKEETLIRWFTHKEFIRSFWVR